MNEQRNPEASSTEQPKRPTFRSGASTPTVYSEDEDYQDFLEIPAEVPLEALAGPALVLPTSDLDGRTLTDEFDWDGKEDDEDEQDLKKGGGGALSNSSIFICMSRNSSNIAWSCIVLLAIIFIAIDVAIFAAYKRRISTTSYGLELWFTWIAFMWCVAFMSQIAVELVPWFIKKFVSVVRPQSIEFLPVRLSYYKALRPYIKMIVISAWAWGSWALIKEQVQMPVIGQDQYGANVYQTKPKYVSVFYSFWECLFFALLFLFIEKFILQLIVTSFHKKAYGDRIKENDRALKILDKLKQSKRMNPHDFLMKKIRRKTKPVTTTSRSQSFDEQSDSNQIKRSYYQGTPEKSIMCNQQPTETNNNKSNVKFPVEKLDTLIAIPALEDRVRTDEKQIVEEEVVDTPVRDKKGRGFKSPFKKKRQATTLPDENTPPPLFRANTTSSTQDDKSFFSTNTTSRNFGTTIPGKLLKGGYNKLLSSQPHHTGTSQAKYLAKKIFNNLVGDNSQRESVIESDFYPFFKTTREATYAFSLFDTDGSGDLTKRELRQGCIKIYRDRKNLTRSMRDLSQATGKLDVILMIVFAAIWAIIVCAAFGVNVGTGLMPLWSAFVAASFIFGSTASDAFESIIFVFVTHPFDSGDRVFIGNENWVVDNVGLMVTTFIKWDGSLVYVKNSVLTKLYIINVRRSGRTGELIDIQVSFNTPSKTIKQLIDHMIEWSNQYPKLYTTNATSTNITTMQNQNAINLSFYVEHSQNWQDLGGRWLRHNNFIMEIKEECERLGISYTLPPQPYMTMNGGNDAPPEAYNMGSKASYGLDGMVQRKPFEADHDGPSSK